MRRQGRDRRNGPTSQGRAPDAGTHVRNRRPSRRASGRDQPLPTPGLCTVASRTGQSTVSSCPQSLGLCHGCPGKRAPRRDTDKAGELSQPPWPPSADAEATSCYDSPALRRGRGRPGISPAWREGAAPAAPSCHLISPSPASEPPQVPPCPSQGPRIQLTRGAPAHTCSPSGPRQGTLCAPNTVPHRAGSSLVGPPAEG